MKNRLLILTICLIATIKMMAQEFTLHGKVVDENNQPLEFAIVSVASQGKTAVTSLKGDYSLKLHSADSVVVKFSYIGFKTKTKVLRRPRGKQTLQVVLREASTTLDEVNIKGEKIQSDQIQELKTKDMKMTPSANGNGVESLVQQQAGVSTHNELSSQYNVRGGAFDENSVYINNVEVFRPFLVRSGQQEGLSVINPYMVDKIGFSTGGYAAKYGDKMSSALDITYKTLKAKSKKPVVEGSLAASLLGADAYIGLGTQKLSWLNSVRYKTTSYLLGSMETKGEYKPNYLDYQTYLSYQPNKRWKLDFIGYISDNHYNFEPEDRETKFGTMENVKSFRVYFDGQEKDRFLTYFGTLGITRQFTANTSLSLLGSAFYTKEQEKYDIQGQYWLDETETSENLGVGTYFEHARNYLTARVMSAKLMLKHKVKKHQMEAAVSLKREHIEENSVEYEMRDSAGYSIPHNGKDLYMVYSLKARNELNANRQQAMRRDYDVPHTDEDYDRVNQTIAFKPETSWNYEVGTHLNLFDHRLHFDLSAFYMQVRNQQLSVMAGTYGFGRMMVNAGKSHSCGIEAALKGQAFDGAFDWGVNYGFTRAVFDEYTDGEGDKAVNYKDKKVPYVPQHTIAAMADYHLGQFTFGLNMNAQGKTYWDNANTYSQKMYFVMGAHCDIDFSKMSISIWGRNLTDTNYNTFAVDNAVTKKKQYFAQRGNPFQCGVDLKFHF